MNTWFTLLYTLTETHVGGAGNEGAVDLPIVRESTTGLPFLPDTALKGVARDRGEKVLDKKVVADLFGPDGINKEEEARAGKVVFTQGTLLSFPLRSLMRPYLHATCPLLLDRMDRLVRGFGATLPQRDAWSNLLKQNASNVLVADSGLAGKPLILEGAGWLGDQVVHSQEATSLAGVLGGWFPKEEEATAERMKGGLVILPDADFIALVRGAPPVRARIRLGENKTTADVGGNLWYEEMLPTDCLFWSLWSLRQPHARNDGVIAAIENTLFKEKWNTQIGAGETTGHGRCWWWKAELSPSPKGNKS